MTPSTIALVALYRHTLRCRRMLFGLDPRAKSDRGICAILLGDDPDALTRNLQDRFLKASQSDYGTPFEQLVSKVAGFVEAPALGWNYL